MSILISRHPKIFRDALASSPVFPLDNLYDREMYDEGGAKQLLGIRKANVIKLWFLWKAKVKGLDGAIHMQHDTL